ncbi:hypothetical protein EDD66_104316 [Mobilisporobacter senegalensis]|uniref:GGDEF domain-containing protein n=1 Tax=Mobilisporobacter senegalensis TaxID=1329262 RepID=A0A3N1XUZ2_9FIRM|nr:hypothetical protein [Mobilisporobacter senegalensis]ROR28727.1 hypothetical protein EDD66_104316 [Mobilisporobacter senegalensis]
MNIVDKFNNKKLMAGVVIFCSIIFFLILLNIEYCINQSMKVYSSLQEDKLVLMLSEAEIRTEWNHDTYQSNLSSIIKSDFATSASEYCFVAVEDELTFIKDNDTTEIALAKNNLKLKDFIKIENGSYPLDDSSITTLKARLSDKRSYLVSIGTYTYKNVNYRLGICSREGYVIEKYKMDIYRLHLFIYILLFCTAFISSIFYLLRKQKKDKDTIYRLEQETIHSRLLIDKLHEDINEAAKLKNRYPMHGYFTKQIVENILLNLSEEQMNKSVKLIIRINSLRPEVVTNTSVLLERIQVEEGVSCLWSKNEFIVLLLNAHRKEAERFIQVFRQNYELFSEDAVENDIEFIIEDWRIRDEI